MRTDSLSLHNRSQEIASTQLYTSTNEGEGAQRHSDAATGQLDTIARAQDSFSAVLHSLT